MNGIHVALCLLIGVAASAVWFGCLIGFHTLRKACPWEWFARLGPAVAAVPLLIAVALWLGFPPVQAEPAAMLKGAGAAAASALFCALLISGKKQRKSVSGTELLLWGLDGLVMEIPQRLMMQSLLFGLLSKWETPNAALWAISCTALVWCVALWIQARIGKQPIDREFRLEVLASLAFSLGVGWAYQTTGLLPIAMAGHVLERVLSNALLKRKGR